MAGGPLGERPAVLATSPPRLPPASQERPPIGHHGPVGRAEDTSAVCQWVEAAIPSAWTAADVLVDNDEILVIVTLGGRHGDDRAGGRSGTRPSAKESLAERERPAGGRPSGRSDASDALERAAIAAFREQSRAERMALAAEAEERFGRKVSWGARMGEVTELFTIATVPVMTRLRFAERRTLDTLIDAGLARSRSEALAWCVRLVGANEEAWMAELREAFAAVAQVRDRGPRSTRYR